MLARLLVSLILCLSAFNAALAQRTLTVPDLSALTTATTPTMSLDRASGWLYVLNVSRINGVKTSALARVSVDGYVDRTWQPSTASFAQSLSLAGNGDIYTLGVRGQVTYLSRFSTQHSGAPIAEVAIGVADYVSGIEPVLVGSAEHWVYFSTTLRATDGSGRPPQVTWRRLDTRTDTIDSTWSYSVTLPAGVNASAGTVAMTLGGRDAVYVHVIKPANGPASPRSVAVTRVSAGSSAQPLWTQEFTTQQFSNAADAQGRLYVMVCPGGCATRAAVLRLNSSGNVDYLWSSVDASRAASQSVIAPTLIVNDNELLLRTVLQTTATTRADALLRIDANGVEKSRWLGSASSDNIDVLGTTRGKLYVRLDAEIRALDPTTLGDVASPALSFGVVGSVSHALALPDGGYLFFGVFDVWYEGKRFRNALRIRPDGLPDVTWSPKLERGTINQVTLTNKGVVVVGRFDTAKKNISIMKAFLIPLVPNAVADPQWGSDWPVWAWAHSFDGGAYFYVLAGEYPVDRVLRVSLATGLLDADWQISVPLGESDKVYAVHADRAGGVWLLWQEQQSFFSPFLTKIQRFTVADRKVTQDFKPAAMQAFRTRFLVTAQHAYIADRRYDLARAGALDPTWNLAGPNAYSNVALAQIRGRYVYFVTDRLQRALLSGTGAVDASFADPEFTSYRTNFRSDSVWVQSPPSIGSNGDDLEYILTSNEKKDLTDTALGTTRNTPAPDKTIVEYFNRDAARYFITGRANEQALLDALPAAFQRTGMQFTAKSSLYRDIPESPVCRFYSSPASGGSNTHFYGNGDDCPALNTVENLRYEGYDFSTSKPVGQSCPVAAPNAVSRLFNNKSSSNQGNHRYVVSVTTKAKMLASGWIDEGVVFCVTGVVDANN